MKTFAKLSTLATVNLLLGAFSAVQACSCLMSAPCQSFANADVVFVGEVTGSKHQRTFERYEPIGNDKVTKETFEGGEVYFKVVETFKGANGRGQITVHSTLGGGDCGQFFKRGQRYVVFASKEGVVKDPDNSFYRYRMDSLKLKPLPERLWTSICSGNREVEAAEDALQYLRNLPQPGDGGTIEGRISESIKDYSAEHLIAKPYGGLQIRATAADGKETVGVTDQEGRFRLRVPVGKYRFTPVVPDTLKVQSYVGGDREKELLVEDAKCVLQVLNVTNNSKVSGIVTDVAGKKAGGLSLDLIPAGKNQGDPGFDRKWAYVSGDEGFSFDGVQPGDYHLSINYGDKPDDDTPYPVWFYPGTTDRSKAKALRIELGTKVTGLDFRLPPKLTKISLSGMVVWKDGKPAAGAEVQLIDLEFDRGVFFKAPVTDESGRFKMEWFRGRRYKIKVVVWQKEADGSGIGIADAETAEFLLNQRTGPVRIMLDTVDPRSKSIRRTTVRVN